VTTDDQVPRLLALAPYVLNHRGVSVEQVARKFRVTPQQIVKDLNILWMCGLPNNEGGDLIDVDMEAAQGEGGVVVIDNADYLARPMRFTADEAMGLIVALRAIETTATGVAKESASSAMRKLRASMGDLTDGRVVIDLEAGEESVRATLVEAIEQGRRVRLTYDGATRGETTTPDVDPARIAVRDGAAYLSAWSVPRQDWRTYRLDRVRAAEVLDEPSVPHEGEPRWDGGWFDRSNQANEVTLDLDPAARWITEYYPTRLVEESERGVRATFVVADPAWLTSLLLRLAGDARVVSPEGVGDGAVDAAREALAAYDDLDAPVASTEARSTPPDALARAGGLGGSV